MFALHCCSFHLFKKNRFMPTKVQTPPAGIHLPVFLGFNQGEAIKSLDNIKGCLSDIMISAIEDEAFNQETKEFIIRLYMETENYLSQIKK